ncbi:prolipoprotein diacylglyceryl transferase [Sulfurimonas sp. HSL-1716]|uniref:prolipoprotein diacylglyceryl transferase n=1 Tax=Hydrocurvibacter sulfurireducens TaxID=3131937 RepID=UPI0031F933E9
MEFWNHVYEHFNPVAFHIFVLPVHWYGMMYVLALVTALYMAKWIVKKDGIDITKEQLDNFFIYVEIGVILGARLGYILFYDPDTLYYLSHPWQIFNPFKNGEFVGIRGMSYHGALFGFLIGAYLYSKKDKIGFGKLMDIVAVSVPLGYVFGRIGNFLNQELVGRVTDVSWGIYVNGILRHPSQLYEAFLEGVVVFVIVYMYRNHKRFEGELILLYAFSYGILRAVAELFRAPDVQIGYICCGTVTLGQALSLSMALLAVVLWFYFLPKKEVVGDK